MTDLIPSGPGLAEKLNALTQTMRARLDLMYEGIDKQRDEANRLQTEASLTAAEMREIDLTLGMSHLCHELLSIPTRWLEQTQDDIVALDPSMALFAEDLLLGLLKVVDETVTLRRGMVDANMLPEPERRLEVMRQLLKEVEYRRAVMKDKSDGAV